MSRLIHGPYQLQEFLELLCMSGLGLPPAMILDMFQSADVNHDGVIEYQEFVPAMRDCILSSPDHASHFSDPDKANTNKDSLSTKPHCKIILTHLTHVSLVFCFRSGSTVSLSPSPIALGKPSNVSNAAWSWIRSAEWAGRLELTPTLTRTRVSQTACVLRHLLDSAPSPSRELSEMQTAPSYGARASILLLMPRGVPDQMWNSTSKLSDIWSMVA